MDINKRDISIDIIKFFAVFLIINSHSDIAYTKYSFFATGGAIGDALFLFCSGFTLFMKKPLRFDNYYKRRINRIYPSVFAAVFVMLLVGHYNWDTLNVASILGGEFIIAIMIYYIFLWIIHKWASNRITSIMIFVGIITLIAYWFFPYKYETSSKGIYGISTLFRWIPYFGVMLMGAYIGVKKEMIRYSFKKDVLFLLLCILIFYGIQLAAKKYVQVAPWQILTVPFLFGIVYYFYKCCNAKSFQHIYESKIGNWCIMVAGGLCLESYLVQYCVITNKLNFLFPLNIPLIMLATLLLAYFTRCLARLFSQTFRTEDYEWKKIFALK